MPSEESRAHGSPEREAAGQEPARGNLRAEVLARMGHELRTPLNAIIGFIRLVEEGLYVNEEERRDYLANARQSALTLLDLINKILDLARIEAGRLALESVELNLPELVEEVAKTLAPEAHAKGVEIDAWVDPSLPVRVRSDPVRLRQVLYNLAGNAVKFTDAGSVLLRAEAEAPGREATRVRFVVRDTGIGVPAELQPVIFDSFVQTNGTHNERLGGVGLGLSIARQIVEQMGGTIGLESRLHAGSTFWFTVSLPRGRTYGARGRARGAGLGAVPLLLVNPDAPSRELYLDKLRALGGTPLAAAGPEQALALLEPAQGGQRPFRAVLVDHHLRRDEALVFARRVRREAGWFQPDLLHLSIIGAAGDVSTLAEAGFTGFLTKPAGQETLRSALASLLGRQGERGVPAPVSLPPESGSARPPAGQRMAHVLVAEDNAVNQKLIQALLTKKGYATRLVANGREAVEALRSEPFDLVLMDVQMPVLDGLAATRELRGLPHGAAVPVIAMTADALDGDRERCLAAGMNDHVPKPIMPDVLHETIGRWLGRSAAPTQSALAADAPAPAGGPPPPGEEGPALDLSHLESVRAYAQAHDPARFAAWLRLFRAEARAALAGLAQAHTRGDWSGARAAVHRLALASGGFGAPHLQALARGAAEQAGPEAGPALELLLPRLEAALHDVERELASRFGEETAGPPGG